MTQLILKTDIDPKQLDVLLGLLKTWNIEAEVKLSKPRSRKKHKLFSETFGIWKDRDIDAKELRRQTFSRTVK